MFRRRRGLCADLLECGVAWTDESIPAEVSGLNGISCPTTTDCTAVGFGTFGSPVVIGRRMEVPPGYPRPFRLEPGH